MKLLKKIRRIASQKNLGCRDQGPTNNLSPIGFHSVHGENVKISSNGTVAERFNSYCKGICFSSRPVRLGERVSIRIEQMSQFWSGVLRFGFTTKDPSTLRNALPKYACPNLTNCGHTYAKALPERYAHHGCLLSFYLTGSGNVHFSIDGVDKGIILANIKMNGPFWAVIDLYGNTNKIALVDARHQLLNNRPSPAATLYSSVSMVELANESSRYEPSPQIYSGKRLDPVQFHRTRGCNVRLSGDKCVAERNGSHYSNGYVFSQRPLHIGEKLVVQVLRTDPMFAGSLAFGITSCNPSWLSVPDLPDDSHHLLDRAEYWTVIKDVANSPMAGDEISFTVTESGEVLMTKNRQRPITLMHVDISQSLWVFFDLYGSTLKIRMLGSEANSSSKFNRGSSHATSMHNVYKAVSAEPQYAWHNTMHHHLTANTQNKVNATKTVCQTPSIGEPMAPGFGNECVVCYEQPVNSVFYTCGHVCMCFKCSIKQWKTSGHCPICRARIVDVIRTYWS